MKGSYHVIVQNRTVKFEFDIKRNITIIRGDSGTGKTTLIQLIRTYENLGDESGISISCDRKCKIMNNSNWESVIEDNHNCIIFTDEETKIVKTTEFAQKIKNSDNYYVIVTRENLPNLPYSVNEIYGIHRSGRYASLKQTYNTFYRLYNPENVLHSGKVDAIIVEDTNSGYEFYNGIKSDDILCISSGGKTKVLRQVKENQGKRILVIVDGAAFGSEMNELHNYMQSHDGISVYLPESFEWIILHSGLIDGNRVMSILEAPEEYIESSKFFSWEQFFTSLLISETADTYLRYTKSRLNKAYLGQKERQILLKGIEVIKVPLGIVAEDE